MPDYTAMGTVSATGVQSAGAHDVHVKPGFEGTGRPKMEYEGEDKRDLGLVVHGIDDTWTLQSFLLALHRVTQSETAEYVAALVREVTTRFLSYLVR